MFLTLRPVEDACLIEGDWEKITNSPFFVKSASSPEHLKELIDERKMGEPGSHGWLLYDWEK